MHIDMLGESVLVAEVLSDSSEGHDRGRKLASHQRILSLAHHRLVSQNEVRVAHYRRISRVPGENQWRLDVLGAGRNLALDAIECRAPVDLFYTKALLDKADRCRQVGVAMPEESSRRVVHSCHRRIAPISAGSIA